MDWTVIERAVIQRTVACFAIEHFHHIIRWEMEGTKRRTLLRLLEEEEAKLKALDDRRLSNWRNHS